MLLLAIWNVHSRVMIWKINEMKKRTKIMCSASQSLKINSWVLAQKEMSQELNQHLSLVNQFSDLVLHASAIWPVSFPIMKTSVTLHCTDLAYSRTDCKNNLMWHVVKYKRSVSACGYKVKYVWCRGVATSFGQSGFEGRTANSWIINELADQGVTMETVIPWQPQVLLSLRGPSGQYIRG